MPNPNTPSGASVYTDAHALAADLRADGREVMDGVRRITRHHGMLLETRIKANVYDWTPPQQPMQHVRTGHYRRSWTTQHAGGGGTAVAVVGTNAPQARRLEYGFQGADRIGRVYNDPPRPHVGPAFDVQSSLYIAALRELPGW